MPSVELTSYNLPPQEANGCQVGTAVVEDKDLVSYISLISKKLCTELTPSSINVSSLKEKCSVATSSAAQFSSSKHFIHINSAIYILLMGKGLERLNGLLKARKRSPASQE